MFAGGDLEFAVAVLYACVHNRAEGLFLYLGDKVFYDRELNISLEQRHANVFERIGDIIFGKLNLALQTVAGA